MLNKNNINKKHNTNNTSIFTNKKYIFFFAIIATFLWGSAFPGVKIGYKLWNINSSDIASTILFAGIRFFFAGILTIIGVKLFKLDSTSLISTNINCENLVGNNSNKKSFDNTVSNNKHIDNTTLNRRKVKSIYLSKDFFKACLYTSFFMTTFQYICFYIGLSRASGVNSSVINSSGTIFTVLLAFILYKNKDEKPNVIKLLGCILSFAGIIIISIRDTSPSASFFSLAPSFNAFRIDGEGLLIVAALSFSAGNLISKHFSSIFNPATLTGMQLGTGGFILICVGILLGGKLDVLTLEGVLLLSYLSALSAVAFTLWTILLKHNPASKIAIFNFLTPLFGVLLSGLILGENIANIAVVISLVLTCTGIYIMQK